MGKFSPAPQQAHVFKTHTNDQLDVIGQIIFQQEAREYHPQMTFQENEYKLN